VSTCIFVSPIGFVQEDVLHCVAACLEARSKMAVRVLPAMGDPCYAYDEKRKQYSSKPVLKRLAACCPHEAYKVMGVTRVDLFIPILTFVFGAAVMSGNCAVISTQRLDPGYYNQPVDQGLFLARVEKTAVHEFGHSLGLIHCRDRRCVMFSSSRIEDTDFKKTEFCSTCRELFKWRLDKRL